MSLRLHLVRTAGRRRVGLWPTKTASGRWALVALDVGHLRLYATTAANRAVSAHYRRAAVEGRAGRVARLAAAKQLKTRT